jgi:hypothetical protein
VEAHVAHIFYKLGLLPTADEHRRVMAVVMSCAIIKRIPQGCLHSHDKRTISYSRIVRGHA